MDAPEPSRGKPAFKTACGQTPLFSPVNVRTAHTVQPESGRNYHIQQNGQRREKCECIKSVSQMLKC